MNLSRSLLALHPQPWILAVDASPRFILLALGHERAVVPPARDRDAYIEALNALVREHGVDFIMPNNSLEIRVLSEARAQLAAPVFLPAPRALRLADDKWASHQVWRDAGVPVPETHLLVEPADVARAFEALQPHPETPVWVRGAGIPGRGIGVASLPCRTVGQAVEWVSYWRGWGGMIASAYLPGDNLTWMGLFRGGELLASQGRQRDAYVIPHVSPSGITGAPAVSHTIRDPLVNETGEAAVRAIDPGFEGVCFVDMKGDGEGRPRVTELNAGRFGTTHFFYTVAGANFPGWLLRAASGREVDAPRYDVLPADLYWIRTLDAGPVLVTGEALRAGRLPAGPGPWPPVPQRLGDFQGPDPLGSVLWR